VKTCARFGKDVVMSKKEIFMKKTAKLFGIAVLMLLTLFSMVTCDTGVNSDPVPESPYLGDTLVVTDQQAYELNLERYKLSTMLHPYTGPNLTLATFVLVGTSWEIASSPGEISNGKFSVTVPGLTEDKLVTGDALLSYLPDWHDTPACAIKIVSEDDVDLKETKIGNLVNFFVEPLYNKILMRQRFSGTRTSLSGETIYIFYVTENCIITANKGERASLEYTYAPLNLPLKKGWNTVCMKETYTVSGKSIYSAEVKNPDIAWAILQ